MQPWVRILAEIAAKIPPQSYEVWFRPTVQQHVDLEEKRISVQVPNQHFRYWLAENYEEVLAETMEELGMGEFQVSFVVAGGSNSDGWREEAGGPSRRTTVAGLKLNERYTFESFVVGFSNQFAHAAAMAVAARPSYAYNPLFIYGGVGLGKTHLMHAIGHRILAEQPSLRLCYMSSERFMNELIHAIRYEKQIQFREKYRNIDVLLMDDIQFLAGKERTQEEFFHTFNALYDSQKQIIISSDAPPRRIPTLEERLHSRFEWGLIADIQPPDLETKVAILRKKAEAQQLPLDDDVALFIATAVKSNIRELEGALIRLAAFHSLTEQDVTVDLARRVLHNLVENQTRMITIGQIQRSVAEHYSVRVSDLKAKDNSRRVAEPRQIAMFLSKELTANSLSQIGKEFGGKHHTTVMHAIRKVQRLQKTDAKLRAVLERLTEAIQ